MAEKKWKKMGTSEGGGAVYAFGIFGALFYYLQSASTFSEVLLGIVKAIVWPGIVVYKLIEFLG